MISCRVVPKRSEIETILRDEVGRARRAYQQAHLDFNSVTADIPSGLPAPDGTERIRNAGHAYRSTMNVYSDALREFNNFITDGVIPERLGLERLRKESGKPAATG
jgi:hypothetical protein